MDREKERPVKPRSPEAALAPERSEDKVVTEQEKYYYASHWSLVWLKFSRHKLAIIAGIVLIVLYLAAVFASFLSPHDPNAKSLAYKEAPPQRVYLADENGFQLRPFVYAVTRTLDRQTYQQMFQEDRSRKYYLRFFARGFRYKLLGLFETDIHLFGTGVEEVHVHLFGADILGRDVFTRVLYGARVSLTIGLVGVTVSFILGILIGGVGGYFGGTVDEIIQRGIEILNSIPKLPLWMGLSAALPLGWTVIKVYFAITIILSLLGWTNLARTVRGRFLSLREEDFIIAARLAGMGDFQLIVKHMVPSFMSHIIASLTLSIPAMILGETALSFLGLGMQPPAISWGVLLKAAQNVHTLALAPWLMIPGLFVIIAVLAFNFLGDGLRDAADPYTI